jgi:hypothetical protein
MDDEFDEVMQRHKQRRTPEKILLDLLRLNRGEQPGASVLTGKVLGQRHRQV